MKTFSELCPFRKDSSSEKVYRALAATNKPLSVIEIAKRAKVPLAKTQTLVAAYFNRFHCAPLARAGVEFLRDKEGGIKLGRCKPDAKAKRPERGLGKKRKQSQPKKGKSKSAVKVGVVKQMPTVEAPTAALGQSTENK